MPIDLDYTVKFEAARKLAKDNGIGELAIQQLKSRRVTLEPKTNLYIMAAGTGAALYDFSAAANVSKTLATATPDQYDYLIQQRKQDYIEGEAVLSLTAAFAVTQFIRGVNKVIKAQKQQEIISMAMGIKLEEAGGLPPLKNVTPTQKSKEPSFA